MHHHSSQVYDNQPDKSFTISALKLLNRATIQPKRPLLYAAFISPLALLVPQKLASKPAKQYLAWDMLQVRQTASLSQESQVYI